jgi:hypothetical protein
VTEPLFIYYLETFRGEIKALSNLGMSKEEQYWFYGMAATSIGFYGRETRKVHLLKLYTKETDPCLKEIIGGRYPFSNAELKGADAYVRRYGRNPKYFFLFPLAFLSFEVLRFSLRGLWRQKK